MWEFFVTWLYGDIRKAPLGNGFDTVNGGRETRDTVEFNAGSLGLHFAIARRPERDLRARGRARKMARASSPRCGTSTTNSYPIERPLLLVTGDRPTGDIRKVIDFMCGAEGQELVKKSEFVPLEAP